MAEITYEFLRWQRDLAAYRVVGHMNSAINHLKAGTPELALSILEDAKALHEKAEKNLDRFNDSKKQLENSIKEKAA
jgi:hypothetical protein